MKSRLIYPVGEQVFPNLRKAAAKWKHDGRPVRLLAISVNKETRTVDDWLCE